MPSAELQAALDMLHKAGGKAIKITQPLDEQRAEVAAKTAAQKFDLAVRFDEISIDGLRAVWVTPPEIRTDAVHLFFHGGAYAKGPLEASHGALVGHLKALGARGLSVDYRLAPEHPYPAALEDARRAYRYLLDAGHSNADVVVSGSSAGGGLALALIHSCRERGDPQPLAAVLISPWGDLTNSGTSVTSRAERDPGLSKPYLDRFAAYYVGDADPLLPTISPVLADYAGVTSAILVQVGSEEILYDDARQIVERARAAGIRAVLEVCDGGYHGWQNAGDRIPEAVEAYRSAAEFVNGLRSPRR